MTKFAKQIHESDNVATTVSDFAKGEEATVKFHGSETRYTCNQDVPFGHKIAIKDIAAGEQVVKYGEHIGSATQNIKVGDWVHTHNLKDDYLCLDKNGDPLPGQEEDNRSCSFHDGGSSR